MATKFDGTTNCGIKTTNVPTVSDFSIVLFFNCANFSANGTLFQLASTVGGNNGVIFTLLADTAAAGHFDIFNNGGGVITSTASGLVTNQWYACAYTHVGTAATGSNLYWAPVGNPTGLSVLGASSAETTYTPAELDLGNDNGGDVYDGSIAGFKFWTGIALRPDEIAREFQQLAPVRTANLWDWLSLDSNTTLFGQGARVSSWSVIGLSSSQTLAPGPQIPRTAALPALFIQVAAAGAPTFFGQSFPDVALGRGTHASLLFPFTGPIPTPAKAAAPYEGYIAYPDRVPGPLWNRSIWEQWEIPPLPERTSPYFRNDYPDRMPQPQAVAFQQYAAAIPMRPERTSPLAAQAFPDRVPGPQQPQQMPVAALPMAPERTSPLAAQNYPDTVPGPRQPQHMHVAAMSLPLERTSTLAAQFYPDRVPGPLQPQYMAAAAIPIAPERKSPLAAQWYPDTVPGARPPQYMYVAAINEVPERVAPLAAQWYPERVPGPVPPQYMHVAALYPLPIVAAPAPIEGYWSYPDRVPGPAPTPAHVYWTEISPKPITTAAAPYEGYASYPDRFPVPPPQYLYTSEQPPLPITATPAPIEGYASYPDRVPGPQQPQYLTVAVLPLAPERRAPLAAQWYPDTILRSPAVAQQQDQAARDMAPERTAPLAAASYPDRVDGRPYHTSQQPFATVVGTPEAKLPADWSTSYPDAVRGRSLPTAALPFETHPTAPPVAPTVPTIPLGWAADVPRRVSYFATLQFFSWLDSPTAPLVTGVPLSPQLTVDGLTDLALAPRDYSGVQLVPGALTIVTLAAFDRLMPTMKFPIGNTALVACTLQQFNYALNQPVFFDPTSIAAVAHAPDGSQATLTVTRQSVGLYTAPAVLSIFGAYIIRFSGLSGIYPFLQEVTIYAEPDGF